MNNKEFTVFGLNLFVVSQMIHSVINKYNSMVIVDETSKCGIVHTI